MTPHDTPTVAQIKARHVKIVRENGAHCQMCSYVSRGYYVAWPCDAFTLLAEVERLEGDIANHAQLISDAIDAKAKLAQAEARCQSIEMELRQRLWLKHGRLRGHLLYGDDGEMDCNVCFKSWRIETAHPSGKDIRHFMTLQDLYRIEMEDTAIVLAKPQEGAR